MKLTFLGLKCENPRSKIAGSSRGRSEYPTVRGKQLQGTETKKTRDDSVRDKDELSYLPVVRKAKRLFLGNVRYDEIIE